LSRRKNRAANEAAKVAALRRATLRRFLEDAQTFRGVEPAAVSGLHLQTTAGERVYLCVQGATLIASPDDSGPVGMAPRAIDQGEFVVTSTRAAFTGTNQVRQWAWSQLVGIEHASSGPWTSIDVANRRRSFGVRYDKKHQDEIRFSIELAVAAAQGTREHLIHALVDELSASGPGGLADDSSTITYTAG
jgi:hypothetical protein